MKKLGKLNINPEKVMKHEELVLLRGGYDSTCCAHAWAPGLYPWDPPTYTFAGWPCDLVVDWMEVWDACGYLTGYCAQA